MDMNDVMKMMLNSGNIGQMGKLLGVNEQEATSAIEEILPMLIKGMQGQATNKDTQQGFLQALQDHSNDDTGDFTQFLKNVDTEDGAKIVGHILGDERDQLVESMAGEAGVGAQDVEKVLGNISPSILSGLSAATSAAQSQQSSGVDLSDGFDMTDVMGLLGGAASGGGGGGLLGSLFGGGAPAQSSGGGLLGSLLGGGQPEQDQSMNGTQLIQSLLSLM